MLPAMPLPASSSSAVPDDCRANAEFSAMPEAALVEDPVELFVPLDEPVDELAELAELVEFGELELVAALEAGAVGLKVSFAPPKPTFGA